MADGKSKSDDAILLRRLVFVVAVADDDGDAYEYFGSEYDTPPSSILNFVVLLEETCDVSLTRK